MSIETLKILMSARRLSQAELARLANVTRQAVSRWFAVGKSAGRDEINIETKTLRRISDALGIRADDLISSTEISEKREFETALLWDRAYGSLEEFAVALARQELKAVARLVQVYGMFASEKIVGQMVWRDFKRFAKHMHPTRRVECGKICELQRSLGSS
ncbi:MAG: helix-turn-helix transcriptional regulator [Deltaproteobacteria bacterium]|nr:helix-turn-helix transcriptional regulator [Deltaproteobacteria bacterium]